MTDRKPTALHGIDPRTGLPTGLPVPITTERELAHALEQANGAFPGFAAMPPDARIALLHDLAGEIERRSDDLVELAASETGLPRARLTGEISRTSNQLRLFGEVVTEGSYLEVTLDRVGNAAESARPELRRWLEPIGPVLIFAASNFPFAFGVLGGDTASALASGCPVIIKAHDSHPGLSQAVSELAGDITRRHGLPGVLTTIYGEQAGVTALRDARIKASGFTGSTIGGRYLFDIATSRPDPIPFYGELGSINPVVVTTAALKARSQHIVSGFLASLRLGNGQLCTKPGMLLLPTGHELDPLIRAEVSSTAGEPLLNARVHQRFRDGVHALTNVPSILTVARGVSTPQNGSWASLSIFRVNGRTYLENPSLLAEEHFGPCAVIIDYDDAPQLSAILATINGSLTATLHAEPEDWPSLSPVVDELRRIAGRIIYNGWPTGVGVSWATHHGGPWPATTNVLHTSVGASAIRRWLRPICYQNLPSALLPDALRDDNPWRLPQRSRNAAAPADANSHAHVPHPGVQPSFPPTPKPIAKGRPGTHAMDYAELTEALCAAVLADVLDQHGYRNQVMTADIHHISGPTPLAGRARTMLAVQEIDRQGDPYAQQITATDSLQRGDVIIASAQVPERCAFWGELFTNAALARGARGAIIDGYVRDTPKLTQLPFTISAVGTRATDSTGRLTVVNYDTPVNCGGVQVRSGDLVFADTDGVVVIPAAIETEIVEAAMLKVTAEDHMRDDIRAGTSLHDAWQKHRVL